MADHVEVTGTGTAGAVPDVVVLDVRVQCEAPDVAGALAAAADRVTAALQAAADHGVAERDRRTTGMGVSTRWDREGRAVVGYTAHQTVRLLVGTASGSVTFSARAPGRGRRLRSRRGHPRGGGPRAPAGAGADRGLRGRPCHRRAVRRPRRTRPGPCPPGHRTGRPRPPMPRMPRWRPWRRAGCRSKPASRPSRRVSPCVSGWADRWSGSTRSVGSGPRCWCSPCSRRASCACGSSTPSRA